MEITEVRVKLVPPGHDKLRAFCSITIDNDFVIRDLKVIEGSKGAFVAMPSRKLTNRCPGCGGKNHHRASYCNNCGRRLPPDRVHSTGGRAKLHADIAHPINSECRSRIQQCVLESYHEERNRARDPSYRPRDLDDFERSCLHEELLGSGAGDEEAGDGFEPVEPERAPGEEEISPAAGFDPTSRRHRVREVHPYGRGSLRGATDSRRPRWPGEPTRENVERDALPSGGRFGNDPLLDEKLSERARGKRDGFMDEADEPEDNFGAGLFS